MPSLTLHNIELQAGLLSVLLLCAAVWPCRAGGTVTHPFTLPEAPDLTLADVVKTTFQRNPTLQVLQARMDEAAAIRRQADSLIAGDAALQVRHNTGQVGNVEGLREWEWGVELPLWLPGQRDARRDVADKRQRSATLSERALRLTIAGRVRELLWTLRRDRNRSLLAREAWQSARGLENDVERRVQAGELARLDLVLARQETLDRQDTYLQARAALQQYYHRYRILTGLDRIPAVVREPLSAARGVDAGHPALASTMADVAAEQAARDRAKTERRDNPTLFVGTRHERANATAAFENTLGISLRVPFGLPSQSAPRVAAAETSLAESRMQRDLMKRRLDMALQQASDELASTRATLAVVRDQADLARENLKLIQRSFDLGESDLFQFLQVQARAFRAELKLRQSEIALQADIARYNQAVGIIP